MSAGGLSPGEPRDRLQGLLGDAYRIERELPAGGMSRLFLATETTLRRPVVIKLLPPERSSDAAATRFQREMQLAAQLQHPHVLPVLAAGARDGLLYYIMPYLPGESLRQRLRRDPKLPIEEASRILCEVAEALAFAHRCGVVHRDVKPENILLEQGHAIVTDFGIARALVDQPTSDRLTATGVAVGTPGYMAPEQAAGEPRTDGRADVYSLGVIGYEMIAGQPPFIRPTAQALLAAHMSEMPAPLRGHRADVPDAVCDAIERALAKAPGDRFASASEFRDAILRSTSNGASGARAAAAPAVEPRRAAQLLSRIAGAASRLLKRADSPRDAGPAPTPRTPSVSECTIAVLPFTVRGRERLAYLGDGLVDLLSMRLDGAGGYRVSDPRAVLGITEQSDRLTLDPARAGAIAERLGAGRFILGSLLEVGGRLQLSASLYDRRGTLLTAARATADEEAQIFELVDAVTIQLLAADEDRDHAGVIRLATATTHSLPALRAYLNGERHFRRGQYALAEESFQRAVDDDPMFALAWYRLSMAAEWSGHRELQDEAAEQALHRSGRLSEHERRLLEAFVAWRRGHRNAEGLYRNIVAVYPNDIEAWFQLGEVLFHYGPLRGRPLAESRQPWERVLAFEPKHLAALHHLARIAAVEGNRAELDELTNRLLEMSPEGERAVEMTALRAFALGDGAEQQRTVESLRTSEDTTLLITVRTIATHARHIEGALALAMLATEAPRSDPVRALGFVQGAYLETARGRWTAADALLARAEPFDPALALTARGLLSLHPVMCRTDQELGSVLDRLMRWDAAGEQPREGASMFLRIHNGVYPQLRFYLTALLALRTGDLSLARAQLGALAARPKVRLERELAKLLRMGVEAEMALEEGGRDAALAALAAVEPEIGYAPPIASPFYSGSRNRYLRAELLRIAGKREDALSHYRSFNENSVYDLIYEAPATLRRAEILEQAGRSEEAESLRVSTAELWRQCDPGLRPILERAIPVPTWPHIEG